MISSRRHLSKEVYQLRSEADEKTLVRLSMPTPKWLDREYPYVPPPDKGGTLRELKFLLSLVPERRENLEFIQRADEDFLSLFLELCEEIGTPVIEKDLRDILAESTILILKLKWLYNRPRPYQVARKYGIPFSPLPSKTANTPAYPGGHTIQAYLIADYLSERAPHHRKVFMDLASQISWSRALGGYHWPSDLIFGKSLYQSIANKNLPAAVRVAAKYKKKREVPRTDGKGTTTIYEYSDRQIANRHKEKAQRIEALRKKMSDLRAKARKDLDSEDPKVRLTALAVCLMDETYERVGNSDSADNGHFGVTTWKAEHVTLSPKKAVIKYVGKSGVEHEKEVTQPKILAALKKALEGKKKTDNILCEGDDCKVAAKDVNEYLKAYDVTAKDIRGLHANEEMKRNLKKVRSEGGKLPSDKKEKEKVLKEEFKKALELSAEAVGHESATLRGQYLVPGMEEEFLKGGKVLERLDKKASLGEVLYFAYGSNLWPPQLKGLLPKAVPVGRATLPNHRIEFVNISGEGFANIVPSEGRFAQGFLFRVPERELQNLDLSEGVYFQHYRRGIVRVFDDAGNPHHAVTYISTAEEPVNPPEDYRKRVEMGREYWGLGSRFATLSNSEKEDREAERLVQQSPKKKPPRNDLRRNTPKEEDKDPDKEQDRKDRSNNYKDAACSVRVALLWVDAAKKKKTVTVRHKETGRPVQVSEDTLRENPGDYEEIEDGEAAGAKPKKPRSKKPKTEEPPAAPSEPAAPSKPTLESSRRDLMDKYKNLGLDEEFIAENLELLTEGSLDKDLGVVEDLLSEAADKSETMLKMKGGLPALRKRLLQEYEAKGIPKKEVQKTVSLVQSGLQPDELDEIRGILVERSNQIQKHKEGKEALLNKGIRTPSTLKAFRESVEEMYSELGVDSDEITAAIEHLSAGDSKEAVQEALQVLDGKVAEVAAAKERSENQKTFKKLRAEPMSKALSVIPADGQGEEIEEYLSSLSPAEFEDFQQTLASEFRELSREGITSPKLFEKNLKKDVSSLVESTGKITDYKDPKEMGKALARLKFKQEILDDPTYDREDPLPKKGSKPTSEDFERSLDRAERSVGKYRNMPKEEREEHLDKIEKELESLEELPDDNPRKMHLNAIRKGIGIASALTDGMEAEGIGGATARLIAAADKGGNLRKILSLGSFSESSKERGTEAERVDQHVRDQELIREIFAGLDDEDWEEMLPEDHPGRGFAELLGSNTSRRMDENDRNEIRENLADLMLGELQILEPEIEDNVDPRSTRGHRENVGKAARPGAKPRNPDAKGIRSWVSNFLKELAETAKSKIKSFMGGSERSSPKRTAPKRTAPKRTAPKRTSPKRTSPEETSPKRTSPKRTSPEKTSPKRTPKPRAPRKPKTTPTSPAPASPAPASPAPASPAPESPSPARVASSYNSKIKISKIWTLSSGVEFYS